MLKLTLLTRFAQKILSSVLQVRLVVGSEPRESWDQLSLEYVVPWPLHLLITPRALANYNKVRNAVF